MGTRSESGKPLSQGERRTLDALASLALVNGEDLARIQNRNASGVHASLRGLQKRGLIESVQLGCLLPQTERWLLTDLGQLALGLQDSSWHQPGCRQRLLERIAAVEWIFQAAGHLQEFGQFHEWTWVDGAGFDAAARSERGWVCFMWAGPLRIEARIRELVEQVGEDLESLAVDHPRPRRSLICCLVWDAFQVEIVLGVARRYRMEDWVRVWCVADDTWHGATGHLDGRGWVFQPAYRRNVGPEAWEARMQESPWSRMNNMDPKRNLTLALRAIKSARSGDKSVELAAAAIRTVTATEDAEGKMHAIESLMEGVKLYVNAQCQCGHKGGVSDSKTCGIHDAAEILGRAVAQIRRPVGTRDVARALYAPAEWPGITVFFHAGPASRTAQRPARSADVDEACRFAFAGQMENWESLAIPTHLGWDELGGRSGPGIGKGHVAAHSDGPVGHQGRFHDPRIRCHFPRDPVRRRRVPGGQRLARMGGYGRTRRNRTGRHGVFAVQPVRAGLALHRI